MFLWYVPDGSGLQLDILLFYPLWFKLISYTSSWIIAVLRKWNTKDNVSWVTKEISCGRLLILGWILDSILESYNRLMFFSWRQWYLIYSTSNKIYRAITFIGVPVAVLLKDQQDDFKSFKKELVEFGPKIDDFGWFTCDGVCSSQNEDLSFCISFVPPVRTFIYFFILVLLYGLHFCMTFFGI